MNDRLRAILVALTDDERQKMFTALLREHFAAGEREVRIHDDEGVLLGFLTTPAFTLAINSESTLDKCRRNSPVRTIRLDTRLLASNEWRPRLRPGANRVPRWHLSSVNSHRPRTNLPRFGWQPTRPAAVPSRQRPTALRLP